MTKLAKKSSSLLAKMVKGMAAPSDVYDVKQYRYPHNSERDALRSDWERVGGDFKVIIERENGKTAAK